MEVTADHQSSRGPTPRLNRGIPRPDHPYHRPWVQAVTPQQRLATTTPQHPAACGTPCCSCRGPDTGRRPPQPRAPPTTKTDEAPPASSSNSPSHWRVLRANQDSHPALAWRACNCCKAGQRPCGGSLSACKTTWRPRSSGTRPRQLPHLPRTRWKPSTFADQRVQQGINRAGRSLKRWTAGTRESSQAQTQKRKLGVLPEDDDAVPQQQRTHQHRELQLYGTTGDFPNGK